MTTRRVPFRSSLRFRVMIGVLIPLVIIFALASLIQFLHNRDILIANLQQFSATLAQSVEGSLAQSMLHRDRDSIVQVARDLASQGSVRNVMILDSQGVARVASREADIGTSFALPSPADSSHGFVSRTSDGTPSFRTFTPIRNQTACQSCHGTGQAYNGTLVLDLSFESVYSHLWSDFAETLIVSIIGLVLVAFTVYLSLDRIVLIKLQRLSESLKRYMSGDYRSRVPIEDHDELGELAKTVNTMAEGLGEKAQLEHEIEQNAQELERRATKLGALYRIALESSRSLNLDQVMQAGLDSALFATDMDAGEIHLVESGSLRLALHCSQGSPPEFLLEEKLIACGECLCGLVAARGLISVRSEMSGDPQVTRLACQRHGFRAIAAVPLKARGQSVGVLTLHRQAPREFSDDDVALLTAIGDQLGMAIDNARLYSDMEARVGELSRRVQYLAVGEERVRLAREIHDGFAQALSVLHLKLQVAGSAVQGNGELASTIEEMQEIIAGTYDDVRQAIGDLRTPVDQNGRLVETLSNYATNFALRNHMEVQVNMEGSVEQTLCSPDVETQVIRIVQEALTNIRKHSRAKELSVQFGRENGNLKIEIRDDGRGFDGDGGKAPGGHYGLAIMRERAASIGATVEIEGKPDAGTRLTLQVPILPNQGKQEV